MVTPVTRRELPFALLSWIHLEPGMKEQSMRPNASAKPLPVHLVSQTVRL